MKGVRGETEWQAAEGAACGGGQGEVGGLMQVPNSTSAQGVFMSHLSYSSPPLHGGCCGMRQIHLPQLQR